MTGRVVDIGGVAVLLEAGDEARAEAMTMLLGALPTLAEPPRVAIRYLVRPPALPRRTPDQAVVRYAVWQRNGTLHLADRSGARARVTDLSAWIGGGADRPANAFRALFPAVACHLLAFQDRFVLHAAAILGEDGAYLVCGGSGGGKSTLALAALDSGWPVLSDDLVVLRRQGAALHVSGIHRPVAVPADVKPVGAGPRMRADARGRSWFSPTCLRRGWAPVAGVVAVGHASSPDGTLLTLDGHRAVQIALGSFASTTNPLLLRRFFPLAAMLGRLPAWELQHGSDAATRLGAAARLLDGVEPQRPAPRRARRRATTALGPR